MSDCSKLLSSYHKSLEWRWSDRAPCRPVWKLFSSEFETLTAAQASSLPRLHPPQLLRWAAKPASSSNTTQSTAWLRLEKYLYGGNNPHLSQRFGIRECSVCQQEITLRQLIAIAPDRHRVGFLWQDKVSFVTCTGFQHERAPMPGDRLRSAAAHIGMF